MMLLGNGRVVTRDMNNPFLQDGCVVMDAGLITALGGTGEMRALYPDARFIDARGGVIMPGLINAHEHIYSALARGLSINGYAPGGFLDILSGLWWTLDEHLSLDMTRMSAEATLIDCVENGVTTIFDHHASYGAISGSLGVIAEAARKYGVRAVLCYEVSDRGGEEKMLRAVRENVDFIRWATGNGGDALKGMMGLHASFTLSDSTLDLCAKENPEGAGYHIHVAEGIEDVRDCLEKHGCRPVFRLKSRGILGEKTICAHCTHIDRQEIEALRDAGCLVAHNPESNMGNAIGCPPVMDMLNSGVIVGLGTDGYTHDMLESYKVANLLQKHELRDPAVGMNEIPRMLFENNREIASRFFAKPLGVIKPGAHADVIVVDYDPPTPMDEGNIDGHTLFGMSGRMVSTTVIAGEVRMLNGELVGVDKPAVMARCREAARALARSING